MKATKMKEMCISAHQTNEIKTPYTKCMITIQQMREMQTYFTKHFTVNTSYDQKYGKHTKDNANVIILFWLL